jgi:hypothetical protein
MDLRNALDELSLDLVRFTFRQMQLQTQIYGESEQVLSESDIQSLTWDCPRLAIRLAQRLVQGIPGQPDSVQGLDIEFSNTRLFRVLDEADLAQYWISPGFLRGSHVLKVTAGGWRDEEAVRRGLDLQIDEWLIVTGNACVSVFSVEPPTVERAYWNY